MNFSEVVSASNLSKSKTFRILSTLEALGYLERNLSTRTYRPGLKVLQLGFTALNSLEIAQKAQPYLKSLSDETGETTNMAIRDGAEIIYIARIVTEKIISVNLYRGSRLPVHCTSMGKALLIDLSPEELENLLGSGPYFRNTPNTITCINDLLTELERIRRRGFSINNEELAFGLFSVAAPIRNHAGKIIAAINVSVPGSHMSQRELERNIAPKVVNVAELISSSLGATHLD
ncbi:MAG: hypothetical protein A2X26_07605 [Chloroflexi bacterium GWC2_49_37]|nr:MAG: hypothetical protein A2X26_07605 [Chloroflexi bacterium GWC2_49_37]